MVAFVLEEVKVAERVTRREGLGWRRSRAERGSVGLAVTVLMLIRARDVRAIESFMARRVVGNCCKGLGDESVRGWMCWALYGGCSSEILNLRMFFLWTLWLSYFQGIHGKIEI